MTTIHTIEDLIRILDERPEWNEALRVRMLSRELLNLPQAFAEFAESTERRLAVLEVTLAEFIASTNQRLATLEEGQARIENDVATLKAAHARNGALRITRRIARIVNCRQIRLLDAGEIVDGLRVADTAGIPQNELDSFEEADIIIEAEHRDTGETHYIAVEASYTASRRDVDRAVRNAEFLTRFTGQPAHGAVASQRIRADIKPRIERGEVHWSEIPQEELETE